jgi:hypothetical protein
MSMSRGNGRIDRIGRVVEQATIHMQPVASLIDRKGETGQATIVISRRAL